MTPEHIKRHDDERLYQPRIHSRRIRELHRIREQTGKPMTVLVDQALREFAEQHRGGSPRENGESSAEQEDSPARSSGRQSRI
jgi:hypothetical protein